MLGNEQVRIEKLNLNGHAGLGSRLNAVSRIAISTRSTATSGFEYVE